MDVPDIPDEEIERYRHMSIDEKLAEVGRLNQIETERQRAEIRAQYGDISEGRCAGVSRHFAMAAS